MLPLTCDSGASASGFSVSTKSNDESCLNCTFSTAIPSTDEVDAGVELHFKMIMTHEVLDIDGFDYPCPRLRLCLLTLLTLKIEMLWLKQDFQLGKGEFSNNICICPIFFASNRNIH